MFHLSYFFRCIVNGSNPHWSLASVTRDCIFPSSRKHSRFCIFGRFISEAKTLEGQSVALKRMGSAFLRSFNTHDALCFPTILYLIKWIFLFRYTYYACLSKFFSRFLLRILEKESVMFRVLVRLQKKCSPD